MTKNTLEVIFTGDFSASGVFYDKIESGDEIFDNKINNIFKKADYVHVNLENPILYDKTEGEIYKTKKLALMAPKEIGMYLKEHNISICNLANNHMMDYGTFGLRNTINCLKKNDILYYGIGGISKYLIINKNNVKIALISSTYNEGELYNGKNVAPFYFSKKKIQSLIHEIKIYENPDLIIYNYHGGTEYNFIPEPKRRELFRSLIDLGIDIIIGHHAHVPQGIELINNKYIVYSLGNFCFDFPSHRNYPSTDVSYFISIKIKKKYCASNDTQISYETHFSKIDRLKGSINLINKNETLLNKIQVFDSEKQYIKAWEQDAFRIFFNTKFNTFKSMIQYKLKEEGTIIILKLIHQTYLDLIFRPNRRPYLIGSIKHIIKSHTKL